jgi:hypothetical protein
MIKVMIKGKRTGTTGYVYVNSLKEIDKRKYIILVIL